MGQWTLHTYKYKWQQHINILYFENTTVVLILPRTSSPSKGWAALNGPLSLSSASINDFQVSSNIFDLKNMKPWQHICLVYCSLFQSSLFGSLWNCNKPFFCERCENYFLVKFSVISLSLNVFLLNTLFILSQGAVYPRTVLFIN